jgi:alpha-aminoadipate carrier protein LysW
MFDMVACPECGEKLFIPPDLPLGKLIDCDWCETELEIIEVNPYTIAEAPPIEDTWGE